MSPTIILVSSLLCLTSCRGSCFPSRPLYPSFASFFLSEGVFGKPHMCGWLLKLQLSPTLPLLPSTAHALFRFTDIYFDVGWHLTQRTKNGSTAPSSRTFNTSPGLCLHLNPPALPVALFHIVHLLFKVVFLFHLSPHFPLQYLLDGLHFHSSPPHFQHFISCLHGANRYRPALLAYSISFYIFYYVTRSFL